jgi:hypothetical protein
MAAGTPSRFDAIHATGRAAQALPRLGTVVTMRSGWLLLALVAALHLGTARADMASADLRISVRVVPHARLHGDASAVLLTAADVRRGYVDVARHYRLQTNAPERVVLQLNPRVGLTDAIDVAGLQSPLRVGADSTEVTQSLPREFTLSYRLWLNSAATPGEYPLPLQVAALVR